MPSIHGIADRHVVIDRRPGVYLSFPDVARLGGRLVCVYRETDSHYPKYQRLLWKVSDDLGRAWGPPRILHASAGHCPRIVHLAGEGNGELAAISDGGAVMAWSQDRGETFGLHPAGGLVHSMPDRILPLDRRVFLTTAHTHRGRAPRPECGQAPIEQMVYLSRNRGMTWEPLAVHAFDPCLTLCEASMCRLPDGRLLALFRENSGVCEPMYRSFSADDGQTWSEPAPTPFVGHRPTLGLTSTGRLLVTYRCVGPHLSTSAWLGGLDELCGDYQVHGLAPSARSPRLTPSGLLIDTPAGPDAAVRYALRPLSAPGSARAELSVRLAVEQAEPHACCIRFGGLWWSVTPGAVLPLAPGGRRIAIPEGEVDLAFSYEPGQVRLRVNGRTRHRRAAPLDVSARAVSVGNRDTEKDNGGRWRLLAMRLSIEEPRYSRRYAWSWTPADGLPDARVRRGVLELADARGLWGGDMGYSGWCELPDGTFFCCYHHADAHDPDYEQTRTAYVRGSFFSPDDFSG